MSQLRSTFAAKAGLRPPLLEISVRTNLKSFNLRNRLVFLRDHREIAAYRVFPPGAMVVLSMLSTLKSEIVGRV